MRQLYDDLFGGLTGHLPLAWQRRLYDLLVEGSIPGHCDIPTGLGKTSVIVIWSLALAAQVSRGGPPSLPRRLVYVVNRRTVVDQATREVELIHDRLRDAPASSALGAVAASLRALCAIPADSPLAVSTLRGEHADNAEWRLDPARPGVVVGTVDMVGSRLLFSAYGRGYRTRPLHAAFLGQDALLVHDEAHLEPAFQALVAAVAAEQARTGEIRPLRVMALTATPRDGTPAFGLDSADLADEVVRRRLHAGKGLALIEVEDDRRIAPAVVESVLRQSESGGALLVFLNRLEDVHAVAAALDRAGVRCQHLTGTLRGLERDELVASDPVFARFLPESARRVSPAHGAVCLICTSAGEVGVNISGDHLVCDLAAFERMAQRLGRVNRWGAADAIVDVIHAKRPAKTGASALDEALQRTADLLSALPLRSDGRRDASPGALASLPLADRQAAYTPHESPLATTGVLLDAWALTTVRGQMPGRPPVADWLHGPADWEPPETHVAWREEVEIVTPDLQDFHPPADLLQDFPLKPHELLRDRSDRVFRQLQKLAGRQAAAPVWVIQPDDRIDVSTLAELVDAGRDAIERRTVLLPPMAGGLGLAGSRPTGLLDGSEFIPGVRALYDVADRWGGDAPRRRRVWDDEAPPDGMRLVRTIDTTPETDPVDDVEGSAPRRRIWRWYVRPRAADEDGRTAPFDQDLGDHLARAEAAAASIVDRLGLAPVEARAIVLAARWHDAGKRRQRWQLGVGNTEYPRRVLAKSGRRAPRLAVRDRYRHELGSLGDLCADPGFLAEDAAVRDLALHCIAAHHGRGRPHFPVEESHDPERDQEAVAALVAETPRRFARLQRRYGRWGLAYLESILRAADAAASSPDGGAA